MIQRSEREMYDLILGMAKEDARVKVVSLNGSRANPNAPRDRYQDFDIVWFVTDVGSYLKDDAWLARFGERLIFQFPDELDEPDIPREQRTRFAYLMQFTDGNRIDLTLELVERCAEKLAEDPLTVVLYDRDGIAPKLPESSDAAYYTGTPTYARFYHHCNELYWLMPYADKGLRRGELLYAVETIAEWMRPLVLETLAWKAACETGAPVMAGKCFKYLPRLVTPETWALVCRMYDTSSEDAARGCLEAMHTLFSDAARVIAKTCGYAYDAEEGIRVMEYIHRKE